MTNQQKADEALAEYQLSKRRIEKMFAEFFAPPPASKVEYDATLRRVSEEMEGA